MTGALAMIVAGGVLLMAAFRNRSILEILQGVTDPQPGFVGSEQAPASILVSGGGGGAAGGAARGGGARRGGPVPGGSSVYKGVEICNWIIEIIKEAERDVGPLIPTSGVRHGVDPHTASGQTEHSGCTHQGGPGSGAVDFGGYGGSASAEKFRAWLKRNGNPMHGGDSYGDLGHFSLDGH